MRRMMIRWASSDRIFNQVWDIGSISALAYRPYLAGTSIRISDLDLDLERNVPA